MEETISSPPATVITTPVLTGHFLINFTVPGIRFRALIIILCDTIHEPV
jgi:hypothetical protein